MTPVTRPATVEDALWIAPRLRLEDAREIETASGRAIDVLPQSLSISRECFTWRMGTRKPFAIFGVADDPNHDGYGIVWFLATPEVSQARVSVVREAPFWLNSWSRWYPNGLHNVVDSRNAMHRRWLLATGFQLGPTTELNGVPFIYAIRYKE